MSCGPIIASRPQATTYCVDSEEMTLTDWVRRQDGKKDIKGVKRETITRYGACFQDIPSNCETNRPKLADCAQLLLAHFNGSIFSRGSWSSALCQLSSSSL